MEERKDKFIKTENNEEQLSSFFETELLDFRVEYLRQQENTVKKIIKELENLFTDEDNKQYQKEWKEELLNLKSQLEKSNLESLKQNINPQQITLVISRVYKIFLSFSDFVNKLPEKFKRNLADNLEQLNNLLANNPNELGIDSLRFASRLKRINKNKQKE